MITRDKLNSRKLMVTLLTFSSTSGLLVTGHLESGDFATIVLAIVGSYMASQGYVDAQSKK
jgi:hypothetical protein